MISTNVNIFVIIEKFFYLFSDNKTIAMPTIYQLSYGRLSGYCLKMPDYCNSVLRYVSRKDW